LAKFWGIPVFFVLSAPLFGFFAYFVTFFHENSLMNSHMGMETKVQILFIQKLLRFFLKLRFSGVCMFVLFLFFCKNLNIV